MIRPMWEQIFRHPQKAHPRVTTLRIVSLVRKCARTWNPASGKSPRVWHPGIDYGGSYHYYQPPAKARGATQKDRGMRRAVVFFRLRLA